MSVFKFYDFKYPKEFIMKATEIKNIKTLSVEESGFINIMVRGYITKNIWGDLLVCDFEPKWENNRWKPFFPNLSQMLISLNYFKFIKTDECWYFEENVGVANITNALKDKKQ